MSISIPGGDNWKSFEQRAQQYFSQLWGVDLQERTVYISGRVPNQVSNQVSKTFDLVSQDSRYVGDVKRYKNIKSPSAKLSTIAEYVWLLQKVKADKVFMVFGLDPKVAERFLEAFRPLILPVEFYFLDGSGHRLL